MLYESLVESEEEFNRKMKKGLDDVKAGRVMPVEEAFAEIA